MVKNRGQHCGDIELVGYLENEAGPVTLVLDLRVPHDRVGSSVDPVLNGHLRYPNNLDQSLNDTVTVKLRKYRVDYNFNPSRGVGFMTCSFRSYVFTIRSWIYHLVTVSSMIKSTLANFSSFSLVFVFRWSNSTTNPVSERRVDSSLLVLSLSCHRYQYISLLFSLRFIDVL